MRPSQLETTELAATVRRRSHREASALRGHIAPAGRAEVGFPGRRINDAIIEKGRGRFKERFALSSARPSMWY
jgi:hypothetical protein